MTVNNYCGVSRVFNRFSYAHLAIGFNRTAAFRAILLPSLPSVVFLLLVLAFFRKAKQPQNTSFIPSVKIR